jgi:hypothetical protein
MWGYEIMVHTSDCTRTVALPREKAWVHSERRDWFTRVIVTVSLRDLDDDGWWSTYDENVHKLPRVSFLGS